MHLTCTPKFCTSIVFNLSWDGCYTQENWKTKVMQTFGGKKGALWEMWKRHHYLTIPCGPWSSKSRFFLVNWLYISTACTSLYIRASYWDVCSGFRPLSAIRGGATSTNVKKESKREEAKKAAMADATKATTHFVTWPSPRPHWRVRKTTFYLESYQVVILECSVCGSKYCTSIAGVQQRQQLQTLQNSYAALVPKKGPAERISADTKKCGYQNTVKCQLYTQRLNNLSTLSLPEYEGLSLSKGAFSICQNSVFGQPVVIRISLLIKTNHPDQSKPKHYAQRR